eukprot:12033476-Alexandrium_andersonii.AAC.1
MAQAGRADTWCTLAQASNIDGGQAMQQRRACITALLEKSIDGLTWRGVRAHWSAWVGRRAWIQGFPNGNEGQEEDNAETEHGTQ